MDSSNSIIKKRKRHVLRWLRKHKLKALLALLLFGAWWFSLPKELFDEPRSTVVTSREGLLIGARSATDGQWRFPEIDTIPYRFKEAVRYFEDEHFYRHPGVNPVSTIKAIWTNLTAHKRIGGSTLTQQVMRLAHRNPKRTYGEKFIETVQALRLEVRFSKEEIFRMYVSNAPFGGNVIGLSAASWRYFEVPADQLSWGQAATLAVLPNAPSLVYPGKNDELLLDKRNRLLKKLYREKVLDRTDYELAIAEGLPGKPLPLPNLAPHFTDKVKKEERGVQFRSTLDYSLQNKVNRVVDQHYRSLKQNEIYNMAVLVLDNETHQVLAYVGNTPTDHNHDNFVDIVQRRRSTGSILKPFLYAGAFDKGQILPQELVSDVPTTIDGYSPKNYDKKYRGAVPASEALIKSLNVPAVLLLQQYGLDIFHKKLGVLQQHYINKPADYYGLSLILGGAESSLWDVTKAYSGMASTLLNYTGTSDSYFSREFEDPIYDFQREFDFGEERLDPYSFGAGSIYSTLSILKDLNRPIGEVNWDVFEGAQPIAWKTGTSYGFKDAWAVGVTSRYAIGVWVGNADGEGRPGLVGIEAAAPVLFDVLALLPKSSWFTAPYDDLKQVEICKESGLLAGPYCEHTEKEWIPVKGDRGIACSYHHQIFTDENGQFRVNSSCYPLDKMKRKDVFTLPPVEEYFYASRHPGYKVLPPYKKGCTREGQSMMAFIYPKPGREVLLPKDFGSRVNDVIFKLAHRGRDTKVFWYLNDQYLGETEDFHEIAVKPRPGEYLLTAVDREGNEISEPITIVKPD